MTTPKPLRIFCSYSHRDEAYLNELRDWLRGLEHQGLIESWHDREITPGWEWDEAIDKNLRTADIILFLVSSAFMASDYVYENEIGKAVERHKKGEARVIPIIVRPADWQWTSFGKLQALPKDAKPITTWPNRDEAWLDVLKGVRRAVEKLLVERQERAVKERYRKEVEEAWTDNKVSAAEVERLDALASDLGLSADTAAHIERQIMGDNKEAILERQDRERQDRLDELYARARRSHQNQEWQAVVDIFAQIHAEDPTYPDSEELLASAREALEAQESGRRVAAIYAEGQRHMDAGEWQQALRCFEQVRQLRPGYRETEELLSRARQKLAPLRTVEVPDLSGQEVSQASSTLANEGLELGARNEIWSATVPKGQIIEQRPVARTEVEAGSLVSITVSLGSQPELPALAGSSWALFLRGLVLAIFGLALLVMPTVLNVSGSGFFRLASAIVMILDWVFATIDAKTRAGRRRWLSIQGRISLGLGLLTFVTWLVAWLTTWLVPSLTDIELEFPRYLVGLWAIVIGSIRIRAAIQLSWETKYSLLMGASGGLLILFGVGAWVLPYSPFWWSPLGYLALLSGITLIALLWVWNRERSGAVE
jgi:tetratricopeptide (TPR) repeat protein